MNTKIQPLLTQLFESWSGKKADLFLSLAQAGSYRKYFRIIGEGQNAIGTYSADRKETEAFLYLSKHFHQHQLPVPKIYAENVDNDVYLQEDLGDTALFNLLPHGGQGYSEELVGIYKLVVEQLAALQIKGSEGLDYSICYPKDAFDEESIFWDLNYFKYYFLKLGQISFDELALEKDFKTLADYLLQADSNYFMFRDFQSRNIMLRDGQPYFIDYQGGRKGALQYDLASLLFQAKANIPHDIRKDLLHHYMDAVEEYIKIDREKFEIHYYGFVLIRTMQVLGAYGFRGLYERREHFLKSIPFAIRNLRWLLDNITLPIEIPELKKALEQVTTAERFTPFDRQKGSKSPLIITINSFSYKSGYPKDETGHGGGFAFDCRGIHNPGRYQPYKKLTGRDESVIAFLKEHSTMSTFLDNVYFIVDESIKNYIERSFTNLTISFGCTGGQHRSVFAADSLAKHVQEKYGVKVILNHIEQEKKNWKN